MTGRRQGKRRRAVFTEAKHGNGKRAPLFWRVFCLVLYLWVEPVKSQRANEIECDPIASPGVFGYDNLADLTDDMQAERSRIDTGGIPASSYLFILCPNTDFVVADSQPLIPLLDNSLFICGNPASVNNNCVFTGSDVQVFLANDGPQGNFPVEGVAFQGVRFTNFDSAAISGRSDLVDTSVVLIDSAISDFNSGMIASIQGGAFNLLLRDVTIENGDSDVGFVLQDGNLNLEDVTFSDLEFRTSLVNANGNEASVSIIDSSIVNSNAMNIIELRGGAEAMANTFQVSDMEMISRVVQASGTGTTADLVELTVTNNPQTAGNSWQYIEATQGANIAVSNSEFSGNQNVLFGFNADSSGSITIRDVVASNNGGALLSPTADFLSSIVFAEDGSSIFIFDSTFMDTAMIATAIFASDSSDIQVRRTCLEDLTTEGLVFADFDSTISFIENNAIVNSVSDNQVCPEGGPRFAQETSPDSVCFQEPRNCIVECMTFAEFNDCSFIPLSNMTAEPSSTPTSPPSLSSSPTGGETESPTVTASPTTSAAPSQSVTPTTTIAPTMPTQTPTVTASPTSRTPMPTISPSISAIPSSGPTSNPTPGPSISAMPSSSAMPSNLPPSLQPTAPTVQPSTENPTILQVTVTTAPAASPPRRTTPPTPSPTRCKPRPTKIILKGTGKYPYSKGIHVIHGAKDDRDLPFCDSFDDSLVGFGVYSKGTGGAFNNKHPGNGFYTKSLKGVKGKDHYGMLHKWNGKRRTLAQPAGAKISGAELPNFLTVKPPLLVNAKAQGKNTKNHREEAQITPRG